MFSHSVASLVLLAGFEGDDKPSFASVLRGQIKTLRKQLDKPNVKYEPKSRHDPSSTTIPRRPTRPSNERDVHELLDALSDSIRPHRIFDTGRFLQESFVRGDLERDAQSILTEITDSGEISSTPRIFEALSLDALSEGIDPRAPGDYERIQQASGLRDRNVGSMISNQDLYADFE